MTEVYIINNGDIDSDLSLLTMADCNHYKIHPTLLHSPIANTPKRSSSMVASAMLDSQVTLLNFMNGTKRDLSAYPTFKSENYYNSFCHSFHATPRVQGLGDIVNPKFHPKQSDTSAQLLFCEQQCFMYSVLGLTLQTE